MLVLKSIFTTAVRCV